MSINIVKENKKNKYIGKTYGIYTITELLPEKYSDGHKKYKAVCNVCGKEAIKQISDFKKIIKKCTHKNINGEIRKINYKWDNYRIGHIFRGMIQRCYNENNKSYYLYGAKGIKIFEDWINNPKLFEEWSINNGYKDDLTIDRIDSNKDYCPENCRWVTSSDNSKYKSDTRIITVDGVANTSSDWSKICNVGRNYINKAYRKYGGELVIKFIKARLENPDINNIGNQNWLKLYNLI